MKTLSIEEIIDMLLERAQGGEQPERMQQLALAAKTMVAVIVDSSSDIPILGFDEANKQIVEMDLDDEDGRNLVAKERYDLRKMAKDFDLI